MKAEYREGINHGVVRLGEWSLVLPNDTCAELVRRWNTFEKGGSHEALVKAASNICKKAKDVIYIPNQYRRMWGADIPLWQELKVALAKTKEEVNA